MTTTLMDRFVRWNLDFDGDLYGRDERERLRWYEGTSVAAQWQMITVPWAAALLVWLLGKPAVLPLSMILAALIFPLAISVAWVQMRRVDTTPREWSRKRLVLSTLVGLPYVVFAVGAFYRIEGPDGGGWKGAIVGALIGLAGGAVAQGVATRRRRRLDALVVADED